MTAETVAMILGWDLEDLVQAMPYELRPPRELPERFRGKPKVGPRARKVVKA